MTDQVRIVPVTGAAFERAAARDGAGPVERIEVEHPDGFMLGLPLTYKGLRQPAGHYLVRDLWITHAMSGKYVLNFRRHEPQPEPRFFFSAGLALSILPPARGLFLGWS